VLIRLIEGDGNIFTPRLIVKYKIDFSYKRCSISQKIISVHICNGGGNLFIRANGKSCRITFKKKKSDLLLKVVQLINGYMRTPKIEALHRLITRLNSKHNTNIPLLV